MNYPYKLKLLSGPILGRELKLPEGELTIGEGDADLAVPLTSGGVAQLLINPDGIRLTTPVPCWVDGKVWDIDQPLPLLSVVDLDGLVMQFGREEDELSLKKVPARAAEPRAGTLRATGWLPYGIAGVAVILLMSGLFLFKQTSSSLPQLPRAADPVAFIATLQRSAKFGKLVFKWDQHRVLTISGLCQNVAEVDAMLLSLRQRGVLIRNETVCRDQLVANATRILHLHGYRDVIVAPGETLDSIRIKGAIRADERWDGVIQDLQHMAGLRAWEVLNDVDGAVRQLAFWLREKGLAEGLSISIFGNTLMVSGSLDAAQEAQVKLALAGFDSQERRRLQTAFQNIPSAVDLRQYLPAPPQSMGGSPNAPYLELANGMRLQVGSYLANGFEVVSFSAKGIGLLSNDSVVYLPLGW